METPCEAHRAGEAAHGRAEKTDFNDIYNQPDPRAYYNTLRPLGYSVPAQGEFIFRRCVERLTGNAGPSPFTFLDLGCGYGINAALLAHNVTMDALYDRYASPEILAMSAAELIEADRMFFARRKRQPEAIRVIGQDIAERALEYGRAVGLLDETLALNLEEDDPTHEQAHILARADVAIVTGGFSYITDKTIRRLLSCFPMHRRPSIIGFPIVGSDMSAIAAALDEFDLELQKVEGSIVPQRHYSDEGERERYHAAFATAGITVDGTLLEQWLCAELCVAWPRPAGDPPSLTDLLDTGG